MNTNDTQATVNTTVSRDGTVRVKETREVVGTVINTVAGWMAIDSAGKSVQYMYWANRRDAVDYIARKFYEAAYGM